jgi:hypothetical protein
MWNLDYVMQKITEETRANVPRKTCNNVNSLASEERSGTTRFDSMASKNEETKPWEKIALEMCHR